MKSCGGFGTFEPLGPLFAEQAGRHFPEPLISLVLQVSLSAHFLHYTHFVKSSRPPHGRSRGARKFRSTMCQKKRSCEILRRITYLCQFRAKFPCNFRSLYADGPFKLETGMGYRPRFERRGRCRITSRIVSLVHAMRCPVPFSELHLRAEGQPIAFISGGSDSVIEAIKVDPQIVIQII